MTHGRGAGMTAVLVWLRSRRPLLLACVLALTALFATLALTGMSSQLALLVTLVVALFLVGGLVADFARERSFWRDVAELASCPAKDVLARAEGLERPGGAAEQLVFDALVATAGSANAENARLRTRVNEHRDFVEDWVHEVKTPLAAAHLLVENAPDASTRPIADELARVDACVERALFYARADAVDRDYLVRSCDLDALVRQVVRQRARALIGAHVDVGMEGLKRTVFADPKWVSFVLGQMVDNAVKYRRDDVTAPARIDFTAELLDEGRAGERVVLHVRDNGRGIPAQDVPRVFERGFTGENGRGGTRSTGMGLYLVRELCRKMGLSVAVTSEAGAWTDVSVTFPTNRLHILGEG